MPGSVEFNHLLIIFIVPLYILISISDGAGIHIPEIRVFGGLLYPRVARREIG